MPKQPARSLIPDMPRRSVFHRRTARHHRGTRTESRKVAKVERWQESRKVAGTESRKVAGTDNLRHLHSRVGDFGARLAKRTLANLYKQRPPWLADVHRKLDAAVFAACGWPPDLTDEDLLARLLALNLARTNASSSG